jgi:hypothetical protein
MYYLRASACNPDATQAKPHLTSNTQQTKNETTNVVIQQHSCKPLMMDTVISEYPGRVLHIPCVNPAYSFKFNTEVLFKQFFTVAHIFNISWCMQTAHKEIFQIVPTVNRNGTGKPLRRRAHRPVAMCWGFKCLCLEQQPRAWRQLHSLSSASVASNVRMQLPCFHALSITSGLILCCCMMWLGQHFNITYV